MLYYRALLACDSLGCTSTEDVLSLPDSGEIQFPTEEGMQWEQVGERWVCPACVEKLRSAPAANTMHRKQVQGRPAPQPQAPPPPPLPVPQMPAHAVSSRPAAQPQQGAPQYQQPAPPPPPLTIYAPQQAIPGVAGQVPQQPGALTIPFNTPQAGQSAQLAPTMVIPAPQQGQVAGAPQSVPPQQVVGGVLQPVPLEQMPVTFVSTPHPGFKG